MATNGKLPDEKARAIIADPSASEKEWLAACTIMDQKTDLPAAARDLPAWMGLPWSMLVSATGAAGGLMLFVMLTYASHMTLLSLVPGFYPEAMMTYVVAFLAMPAIIFNTLFTYQKHLWQGGKLWTAIQASIVTAAAFSPLAVGLLMTGTLPPVTDFLTLSAIGLGLMATSQGATVLANRVIKNLDGTIGANRIIPYSRAAFCTPTVIFAGLSLFSLVNPIFYLGGPHWLLAAAVLSGGTYLVCRKNRSFKTGTSLQLAAATWNPFLLGIGLLIPLLAANSILGLVMGSYFAVSFVDVLATGLLITLGLSFPAMGALIATRHLRKEQELELHHVPQLHAPSSYSSASGSSSIAKLNKETA